MTESPKQRAISRQRPLFHAFGKLPCTIRSAFTASSAPRNTLKRASKKGGAHYPKTHDLEVLLNLILQNEPMWAALLPALRSLSGFAVEFRYPGNSATPDDAEQALKDIRGVRKEIRQAFCL